MQEAKTNHCSSVTLDSVRYNSSDFECVGGEWFYKDRRVLDSKAGCELVERLHKEDPVLAHEGIQRSYIYLRKRYFWPHLGKDVAEIISKCDTCKIAKGLTERSEMKTLPIPQERFQMISVDLFWGGALPGWRGYKQVLAIIERVSNFVMLIPLKTKSAITIGQAIKDRWIAIFGAPKVIHTDCEPVLVGNIMRDFCSSNNIELATSAIYAHNQNGHVERCLRYVKEQVLAIFEETGVKDWPNWISALAAKYNANFCSTIGEVPYFVVFGQDCRLIASEEDACLRVACDNTVFKSINERMVKRRTEAYLKAGRTRSKCLEQEGKFRKGDLVWFLSKERPGRKFEKNPGPYRVLEQLGSDCLQCENIATGNKAKIAIRDCAKATWEKGT